MVMEDTFLRAEERCRWCENCPGTDHSVSSRNPNHECLQVGLLARGSRRLQSLLCDGRPSPAVTGQVVIWQPLPTYSGGTAPDFTPDFPVTPYMGTCKLEITGVGQQMPHPSLFKGIGPVRACQARAWMRSTRCRRLQRTRLPVSDSLIELHSLPTESHSGDTSVAFPCHPEERFHLAFPPQTGGGPTV